jgi:hypothetical protein
MHKQQQRVHRLWTSISACLSLVVASCASDSGGNKPSYSDLRIYASPYEGVDWINDFALKAQHHDHVGTLRERILAYDDAGYQVLSLMDYSGNSSLGYALTKRIWPPEQVLTPEALAMLRNISILIPNAEEVGLDDHVTSPFMTTYIEVASQSPSSANTATYSSLREMLLMIRIAGGIPCLAHPWYSDLATYSNDVNCIEVYSAYAEAMREKNRTEFVAADKNALLLERWNEMLDRNQYIVGIAVNDHTGPYLADGAVSDGTRDSGKIIVMSKDRTLDAYREAFTRGAVIAVRDNGATKDQYPSISNIDVEDRSIEIDVAGDVVWIASRGVVHEGPRLDTSELPTNARWVRAEVHGDSTVLYLQPFIVRPVGDTDGDYDVDEADGALCDSVTAGANVDLPQRNACADIP